jgi:hypothetical protein
MSLVSEGFQEWRCLRGALICRRAYNTHPNARELFEDGRSPSGRGPPKTPNNITAMC